MNWDNFTFIDLFAGIGGIRLGFESVGGKCVFSSEFDKAACKTYEANFGEHPSGDITKIAASEFSDFANKVMCIDVTMPQAKTEARVYRVGVTNAADRGLDMSFC